MIRILYLHPFSAFGGATKSLAELVEAFPVGHVRGAALAPKGVAAESLSAAGLEIYEVRGLSQWDNTRFGHYRGLRWLILCREIFYWPGTLLALHKIARLGQYDAIHCNEITALPVGIIAKRILGVPLIVHVRSLQRSGDGNGTTRWLNELLHRNADAIVAIDEAVRRTLPSDVVIDVIHNGMKVPAKAIDDTARDCQIFTIGIIGVLHRSKGLYELIGAIKLLRERGVHIRLVVVGENVRKLDGFIGWMLKKFDFSRDVKSELESLVQRHGLAGHVKFTGFVRDVDSIYQQIDAVCFPSHLDAPGRPVFEAALYGKPAIVAMKYPTDDVVVNGQTGVCIDMPTPEKIADAIETLANDRARTRDMGIRARQLAIARFDSKICAEKVLKLYHRIVAGVGIR